MESVVSKVYENRFEPKIYKGWLLMKRYFCMFAFLILLFSGMMSLPGLAQDVIVPQYSQDTGSFIILRPNNYSDNYWKMNNWKKVQKIEISFPKTEKTPSVQPCVKIDFKTDDGGCNVTCGKITPDKMLKDSKISAVTFWAKGDCGGRKATFYLNTPAALYSWTLVLDSADWKKVMLPVSSAFTREGKGKDLNSLNMIFFAAENVMSFMVGDFQLETSEELVAAKIKEAIEIPVLEANIANARKRLEENSLKCEVNKLAGNKGEAKEKTIAYIASDKKNFNMLAYMDSADTSKLLAKQKERDLQIWQDDSIELFISGTLDNKSYNHVIANSIGTLQDYRFRFDQTAEDFIFDKDWNADIQVKNELQPQKWIMELNIPLNQIGVAVGKPFYIQLARENHATKEYSALSETESFGDTANFMPAIIGKTGNRLLNPSLYSKNIGEFTIRGTFEKPCNAELHLDIADNYGNVQKEDINISSSPQGAFSIPLKLKCPVDGKYNITISGKSGETLIRPTVIQFELKRPAKIEFGNIFINPQPKEMKIKNEFFTADDKTEIIISASSSERTRDTARFLREQIFYNLYGMQPSIVGKERFAKNIYLCLKNNIKEGLLEQKEIDKINKLPAEGYYIEATPDKIVITGADEAGLYYGIVTLTKLARAQSLKKHATLIPCAQIRDWPDLPVRMLAMWLSVKYRLNEKDFDLTTIKNFITETVAGNKLNTLSIMLDYGFEFDKESAITDPKGFMKIEDYKEIAQHCKKNFVELIPALQSGGHSANFTGAHPEIQEPGYDKDQANVLHPEWNNILFSCYDDILRAAPDTKYFFIWHDEWWHHPTAQVTDIFQGKKRWEIFRDEIIKNYDYLKKRNIKMLMFCDMLLKEHGGGYPFMIYQGLDSLPRDIIMCNWSPSVAPGSSKALKEMGFTVYDIVNQFKAVPGDIKHINGYGSIMYGHYLQTFGYSKDEDLPAYNHAPYRTAEYCWNFKEDNQIPLEEWRRHYMNTVLSLCYFPARKTKTLNFKTLDLKPFCNLSTQEWFGKHGLCPIVERGSVNIGFVPFIISRQDGNDVISASDRTSISINSELKTIHFLQGTFLPQGKRNEFKNRALKYLHGIPVGEAIIEYDDAPSQILPLRMGINTNELTPVSVTRFMTGTRYTYDTKTIENKDASLYLTEWVNPYPTRKVKNIIWKSYGLEATPVLWGLTIGY